MTSSMQLRRLPGPLLDILTRPSQSSQALPVPQSRGFVSTDLSTLDASKGDRERVVILGSGWAGYILSRQLSASKYQTLVVSPRSYFVFTPLLNSTAVGTLEFRTALEPVRSRHKPNVEFMQGWADDIDPNRKILTVEECVVDRQQSSTVVAGRHGNHNDNRTNAEKREKRREGKRWEVGYDKLIISVGAYSNTFGTPGVREHAFFQRDILDARRIRKRVLECFEIASLPTTSSKLRQQLLSFAIVGGGPTGMEFAAELSDLITEDLKKLYPKLAAMAEITIYDVASSVLSMFEERLAKYAAEMFRREGVKIKTSYHVEELRSGLPRKEGMKEVTDIQGCYTLKTREDGEVGVGMCVWSTGNMMNPFVQRTLMKSYRFPEASAEIVEGKRLGETVGEEWMIQKNPKTGAIMVDDHLRVQLHTRIPEAPRNEDSLLPSSRAVMSDVFALGDAATISNTSLPATAQTANQQAIWLGKRLNRGDIATETFTFKNLGMMTYLTKSKGLYQSGGGSEISGRAAWLIWRGAYLTMSLSWRNKVLIPTYWFLNWAFGRDISRF